MSGKIFKILSLQSAWWKELYSRSFMMWHWRYLLIEDIKACKYPPCFDCISLRLYSNHVMQMLLLYHWRMKISQLFTYCEWYGGSPWVEIRYTGPKCPNFSGMVAHFFVAKSPYAHSYSARFHHSIFFQSLALRARDWRKYLVAKNSRWILVA